MEEYNNKPLDELINEYKQIETSWKRLESEVKFLRDKIKEKMIEDGIEERDIFLLRYVKQEEVLTDITELAKLLSQGVTIKSKIKLTQQLQRELGDKLTAIKREIVDNSYYRLERKRGKVAEVEEDE